MEWNDRVLELWGKEESNRKNKQNGCDERWKRNQLESKMSGWL